MPRRRRYNPRPHFRQNRKNLFVIAAEGTVTEPHYFRILSEQDSLSLRVAFPRRRHRSSPPELLKAIKKRLEKNELMPGDEAWVVADKDQWTDEQLGQVHDWAKKHDQYGFALSNPKFEYWLLLHFEDGNAITSARQCTSRLRRYIPEYDKEFDAQHITRERIEKAVERAKRRDSPPCTDWPRRLGVTTVYKLVENILKAAEE